LNEELFSDSVINKDLIHEYYLLQMSNARNNPAKVKGRGEVHGSGRKLYKQKGTGNARVGDKNSPIRRGGGVAFGPRGERNFTKVMTKKARKLALQGLISLRAQEQAMKGIQGLSFSAAKTKEAVSVLHTLGLDNVKVLVVLDTNNEILKKSFRNIKDVTYVQVEYLNPYDIMHADVLLFTEAALNSINTPNA
jgi:large subunit ribosomal protein L4